MQDVSTSQLEKRRPPSMVKRFLRITIGGIACAFIFAILLPAAGLTFLSQIIYYLATGWASFLKRTLPQITPDYSTVAIGLLAALIFAVCFYCIMYFMQRRQRANFPVRWSLRSSLLLMLLVCTFFIAGTAAIGIAHQIRWSATSQEPNFIYNHHMFTAPRSGMIELGLGIKEYELSQNQFPGRIYDGNGQATHSWLTNLLPYIEQQALYDQIDLTAAWDHEVNQKALTQTVELYLYPEKNYDVTDPATGLALSFYAGNVRVLGRNPRMKMSDITDGLSHTILMGEVKSQFQPWGKPSNLRDPALGINKHPYGFGSPYDRSAFVIFADGAIRSLYKEIDPKILKALSTPNGGDKIDTDF